jgi:hypothetical protein
MPRHLPRRIAFDPDGRLYLHEMSRVAAYASGAAMAGDNLPHANLDRRGGAAE